MTWAGYVSVSPDGRSIACVGTDSTGHSGMWVRALDDMTPRFLPGTAGASYPFWSPDSRQLAFFADGKLKRTAAGLERIETLCDAPDGRGGSWSREGLIAYAPSSTGPLWRVDADRGGARALTRLDSAHKELSHRFPWFLPDGRHFLYITESGKGGEVVYVGSVDSPKRVRLMITARAPIYVEPGYLIFDDEDRLVAQRFDVSGLRLEGDPVRLAEEVPWAANSEDRAASASHTGVLVVPAPPEQERRLALLDRQGRVLQSVPFPAGGFFGPPRLSPDGRRAAFSNQGDIWVEELSDGGLTRLTFAPGVDRSPLWSPDGRWLAFQSERGGVSDLYLRRSSGAGADSLLYASLGWKQPSSWSADGRTLVFGSIEKETGYDIWLLHLDDGKTLPYLRTPANEEFGVISPDGRWIAYQSNESGRYEIFVQSFPTPGTKYQVTRGGGEVAMWAPDGRELFFASEDGLLRSVPVIERDGLEFGVPRVLFSYRNLLGADVAPNGRGFITILSVGSATSGAVQVVLNWTAALGRKR